MLDLACGFGRYAVAVARRGAARVVGGGHLAGHDLAAAGDDPRFTFARYDVAEMPELGTFDLAVAMYLRQYAKTVDELTAMNRNIAANLRPGGRLVALTVDSRFRHGAKNTEKVRVLGSAGERAARRGSLVVHDVQRATDDGRLHVLRAGHLRRVARLCGFGPLRWHPLRVDPALEGGENHYRALVDTRPSSCSARSSNG